ncbi:DNA polymerase epsilon subunit 4 [Hoplias malabaricus]|uniref:DNA polymerase epsilon subunit 4 n=1 Tax=Hoplias malabaricus TaxID=27720 RepID=UPI0034620C06
MSSAAVVSVSVPDSEVSGGGTGEEPLADGEDDGAPGAPGAQSSSAPAGAPTRPAKLPLTRIKALMKADPDLNLASQESVFIIAKATELFVEMIAKDALVYAQQGKRKTLQRKDLDNAIEAIDEFAFLEGTLD